MFSITELARVLLGIVTNVELNVLIRVERNPISSTVPLISSTSIISPTPKGLSVKIAREPKKLARVSCNASATANPPMPSPASKLDIL